MKKVNTLIVGFGLAGMCYSIQLMKQKKSFIIYDINGKSNTSRLASGIINPLVLRRYTLMWNAFKFIDYALTFYSDLERNLNTQFFIPADIVHFFFSQQESNYWMEAKSNEKLNSILGSSNRNFSNKAFSNNFGCGTIKGFGKVSIRLLLDSVSDYLKDYIREESFDPKNIIHSDPNISYHDIEAKHIVFCEGFSAKQNSVFNFLPLEGNKGEFLIIKAPKLKSQSIVKKTLFIVPLENDYYWVGASYDFDDKSLNVTKQKKEWLLKKVNSILNVPYEIVEHNAQIRPTVLDRKPLLGQHPQFSNYYSFNGLGTRGLSMAPLLSSWLFDFIENKKPLPSEVDIKRFY